MSDETKTDSPGPVSPSAAPAGESNGKATRPPGRPAAAAAGPAAAAPEPSPRFVPQTAKLFKDEPCEDCPPAIAGRDWSSALGWLMIGAALALAFIGADLASRGAISRKLGAAGWDSEQ